MIDRLTTLPRPVDQQRELFLHALLANELVECPWPERHVELGVVRQRDGADQAFFVHHLPTRCNASFNNSSTGRSSTSHPLRAPPASCGVSPSARSASRTSASGPPRIRSPSPPMRSRRSSTTRDRKS